MGSAPQTAPAASPTPRPPAPGDLAAVQAFVNSFDLLDDVEELTDVEALRAWLVNHGLLDARDRLREGDLERAVAVREALRDVLSAHNGVPLPERSVSLLNRAAAQAPLTVKLQDDGQATLSGACGGLDAALARLFAIVQQATLDGSWERLKACPDTDCRWAFYDRSRNRSGTWCAMRVCGNRAKARAFRDRHSR